MELTKHNGKYWYNDHELTCVQLEGHQYWLGYYDGEEFVKVKPLISVTQAMKKYKLVKGYSGVPESILNRKAEYGTMVHSDLEKFVKTGDVGFSAEVGQFIEACRINDIKPQKSEFIVYNDVMAGTVDTSGTINGFSYIGDYKTTATYDENYLGWQLSFYEYLMGEKFDKLVCFHFNNGCQVKYPSRKPTAKIDEIMDNERKGGEQLEMVQVEQSTYLQLKLVQDKLQDLENQRKQFEEQEQRIKQTIMQQMKDNGIKQIDNEYFKITYVPESISKTIDTARLKAEEPKLAEKYSKEITRNASLRITIKE